ncbi:MAG: cofactor-independent phosphoglycerate mutase [Clostridia bacterium]|nr:cofactor-independent phosphoglycerate mutase [Clostridia bacterium]
MKYVVVLGDGMADYKIPALGNKTTLQASNKPTIDALAKKSEVGLFKTVPQGMKPGSDVANMSVLGFNPAEFYTGRSPLEAVSIGIKLKETDVTLRCNLVTLSDEENYEDKRMLDYSAGEISTEEAKELVEYLKKYVDDAELTLYPGISYRHCLVVDKGVTGTQFTPPHDISDKPVKGHLPTGVWGEKYLTLMKKSYDLLKDHPINKKRIAEGKNPANSMWLWGEGTKPALADFEEKFGLKGGVISAVDLVKGIGILANMKVIDVPNITGNWDTDFLGKAKAAAKELKDGLDFVYIHMEGPDECGHHGDIEHKIFSIEQISEVVVKTLIEEFKAMGEDFTMLICPDHPTPIAIKTHVSDPVPYLIYRSNEEKGCGATAYDEDQATATGIYLDAGYQLMQRVLKK